MLSLGMGAIPTYIHCVKNIQLDSDKKALLISFTIESTYLH